jgi:hypothetical protein
MRSNFTGAAHATALLPTASDGTLRCGDASTQLTWMDAKSEAGSSRRATASRWRFKRLWFNALRTMMSFADTLQDAPIKKQCGEWSRKVKANFTNLIWN